MSVTAEDLLPVFTRSEVHRRRYDASIAQVRAALEDLRPHDLPLTRALFAVRGLPLLLQGKSPLSDLDGEGSMVELLERAGFTRVIDTADQVVLVVIGRFWRPDGGRVPVRDAEEFVQFSEPGYAKATFGFALQQNGERTELVTQTRVAGTDAAAERRMGAYWLLIRGFSGLIRHEMLAAVARKLG